jgi:hypothetical protein
MFLPNELLISIVTDLIPQRWNLSAKGKAALRYRLVCSKGYPFPHRLSFSVRMSSLMFQNDGTG